MSIHINNGEITAASCNCCNKRLNVMWGKIAEDHFIIRGYQHSRNEHIAILCIPCVENKLKDINFDKKDTTIGYC